MRKKSQGPISIGTSSILVIFIILCLVTFATLSLVSARADFNLSQRTAASAQQYYTANNDAQSILHSLDNVFVNVFSTTNNKTEYMNTLVEQLSTNSALKITQTDTDTFVSFDIGVTDRKNLVCQLQLLYPVTDTDTFYKTTKWQLVDVGTWSADDGLPVFSSNEEEGNSTNGLPNIQ